LFDNISAKIKQPKSQPAAQKYPAQWADGLADSGFTQTGNRLHTVQVFIHENCVIGRLITIIVATALYCALILFYLLYQFTYHFLS
jgi:hypothetical protein